jgi:hypothetical protein
VFGTAGSTTNGRVPHPLRSLQRVGYATVGIQIRGIPPFAKSAKDGAPGDWLHFLPRTRNVPFHASVGRQRRWMTEKKIAKAESGQTGKPRAQRAKPAGNPKASLSYPSPHCLLTRRSKCKSIRFHPKTAGEEIAVCSGRKSADSEKKPEMVRKSETPLTLSTPPPIEHLSSNVRRSHGF